MNGPPVPMGMKDLQLPTLSQAQEILMALSAPFAELPHLARRSSARYAVCLSFLSAFTNGPGSNSGEQ